MSAKQVRASEVRPLPVLEDTLNYLLNFLDSKEHPFDVIHDFVFDRTRSIRQDLTMQNIDNDRVVYMYEKMVRNLLIFTFYVVLQNYIEYISCYPVMEFKLFA